MRDYVYEIVAGSDDEVTNSSPGGQRLWKACGEWVMFYLILVRRNGQ
jgi:hypothetical protein